MPKLPTKQMNSKSDEFDAAMQDALDDINMQYMLRLALGHPRTTNFEVHPISQGGGTQLYGLVYPGFDGCLAWCYMTVNRSVAVFSQPLRDGYGGTSLTNIWDIHRQANATFSP
jgi:hypothetical protein